MRADPLWQMCRNPLEHPLHERTVLRFVEKLDGPETSLCVMTGTH